MNVYLLDTHIISETRRPERINTNVEKWLSKTDSGALYTSAISTMELERGVLRMERKDDKQGRILRAWLRSTVKPIEKAACRHWNVTGISLARYKKSLRTVVTRVRHLLCRYRG
ncbi:PIN domain [Cardiobacterium valvarum]|uniref:PIN domain n=2 Tax=Cardiobacterium valvarum TaxID=194702 RepID=A0A381EEA3_9GAMM|nr:PIN domain [Cardiobacterium valvarum]